MRMRSLAIALALLATLAIPSSLIAQHKDCRETQFPKYVPPPSALLDSGNALVELAALNGAHGDMLFGLRFNDTDSLPGIRPLEGADPQGALVLARSLRPQRPSGVWAVRIRVTGGASPALTVERSTYCPPAPELGSDASAPVHVLVEVQPGDRLPPTGRARVTLELLVAETGLVLRVKLIESSGLKDFDEQLTREWETRRFRPALLDGAPLQAVYRTDGHSPRL